MTATLTESPALPQRIGGLATLARNLGWSWNHDARALYRSIDPTLWRLTRHNPFALLRRVDPARLRSEEHTSELQSPCNLVCRLLLEKKKHVISPRAPLPRRERVPAVHVVYAPPRARRYPHRSVPPGRRPSASRRRCPPSHAVPIRSS